MYRVIFEREPRNNPLTGSARYRVTDCYEATQASAKVVMKFGRNRVGINVNKPRRVGTMINPKTALFGRTH